MAKAHVPTDKNPFNLKNRVKQVGKVKKKKHDMLKEAGNTKPKKKKK